jgi:hypothetical protein
VVTHGAAALESALAEPPSVLIVQLELPLIAGAQLGQILLANPRTGEVALVFLADTLAEGVLEELPGEVIAPPAHAADVARLAQRLLDRPQPAEAAQAGSPDSDGVEGELSQLPLADLVQLFHVSQKSGFVELSRAIGDAGFETGTVVLRDGELVHAKTGSVVGEKALYRLLEWDRGRFDFHSSPSSEIDAQTKSLEKPTRALVTEGLRQAQERVRLAGDLPPADSLVRLKITRTSLPIVIHPLTQEVLLVLEGYTRVGDVVDHCSFPDYQVLRTLRTLINRNMVEISRSTEPKPGESKPGLFSAARGERLLEWLGEGRGNHGTPTDAKLLVVASDSAASHGFLQLVSRLPGAKRGPASGEAGGATEPPIGSVGRLAVNSEVGIEFVELPSDERYAPLWPIAAHGALGVLFVLSSPVSAGLEAVQRAAEVLSRSPHVRIFHLLLLEKENGIEPDALRENLSLFDESALFLIPLANRASADVLLREMFVRILP